MRVGDPQIARPSFAYGQLYDIHVAREMGHFISGGVMIQFVEYLEPRQLLSAAKAPVTPSQIQIDVKVVEADLTDFHRLVQAFLAADKAETNILGRDLNSLHSRPDEILFAGIRSQENDAIHLVQSSAEKWIAVARGAVADAKAIDLRLIHHPGDAVLIARLQGKLANFDGDGPDLAPDDNDLDDADDVDRAINDFFGISNEAVVANPSNVRISQDILSGNSAISAAGTDVNTASQQVQSSFDIFNTDSQTLIE
jgi:hypothetical protein